MNFVKSIIVFTSVLMGVQVMASRLTTDQEPSMEELLSSYPRSESAIDTSEMEFPEHFRPKFRVIGKIHWQALQEECGSSARPVSRLYGLESFETYAEAQAFVEDIVETGYQYEKFINCVDKLDGGPFWTGAPENPHFVSVVITQDIPELGVGHRRGDGFGVGRDQRHWIGGVYDLVQPIVFR